MKQCLLLVLLIVAFSSCKKKTVVPEPTSNIKKSSDSVESVNLKFNTTLTYGKLVDIEGNIYQTIKIGDDTWMAENLRTTHYLNGDTIAQMFDYNSDISLLDEPKFYIAFDSDTASINYANAYTWFTVNDSRGICPFGWHIPTNSDWDNLITSIGGDVATGGKLKEVGVMHWVSPNQDATNESGFTAVGAGYQSKNGNRLFLTSGAFWWSNTPYFTDYAWSISIKSGSTNVTKSFNQNKKDALNVRCVKNKI
jgi:uncharacterized protein (TIGR02145 family)